MAIWKCVAAAAEAVGTAVARVATAKAAPASAAERRDIAASYGFWPLTTHIAKNCDPRLAVDVGGAVAPRPWIDLVPPGEHRGLTAHGRADDPRRWPRRLGSGVLAGEHQRAGTVGRRAGLEVADRLPQHRRLLHFL